MQNEMQINRPEFIEPIPTSPKGPQTPTKSRSQSPVCPGAPVRPHRQLTLDEADIVRPPSLVIPSVEDHRNKGILPDYFIKPEPAMPLWEKRKYILSELERWFTSPLFHQHVKDVALLHESSPYGVYDFSNEDTSNWPALTVYEQYRCSKFHNPDLTIEETCLTLLQKCVNRLTLSRWMNSHFAGMILYEFTLSDGKTIQNHWDTSDLGGLRNAPPLPENDSSDAENDSSDAENDSSDAENDSSDVEDENCSVEEEEVDVEEEVDAVHTEERPENFKITVKLEFTMATLLFWLAVWALWLMLNTYVLCKKYSC